MSRRKIKNYEARAQRQRKTRGMENAERQAWGQDRAKHETKKKKRAAKEQTEVQGEEE